MLVRFTQFWRGHDVGQVVDCDRGIADVYVNIRKVAVFVDEAEEGPEEKGTPPPVEYMVPQLGGAKVLKGKR